jgi:hypothetical protein
VQRPKLKTARAGADQPRMEGRTLRGFVTGLGCAALLFLAGVLAAYAGAVACHADVQTADQAPHLCATAGNGVALSVSAMTGPALVLLLVLFTARRRTIGYATVVFLLGEAALFALWALVSHGTIRY